MNPMRPRRFSARNLRIQAITLIAARKKIAKLDPEPNPTCAEVPDTLESVQHHRRLYCRKYSICLDVAFGYGWPGFSCGNCCAYEPLTMEEYQADIEAMARMFSTLSRLSNEPNIYLDDIE